MARNASTDSLPLSWTTSGSTSPTIRVMQLRRSVGGHRHHEGAAIAAGGGAGKPRERPGLVEPQLARRPSHKVEPDGVGAGPHRGEHPIGIGDPADLDERATGEVCRVIGGGAGRHERAGGRRRSGGADERLTDERAIEPERAPARHGRRLTDARLGDDQAVVGNELAEPPGAIDVDLERPQVAVVEPDKAGTGPQRPLQLALVVDLDERLQAQIRARVHQPRKAPSRVQDGQQQHDVGAGRAQERQLDLLDHEILGQDGYRDRRAHGPQVVDRPTEPVRLAQDRDRRRATDLVCAGARDDVLIGGRDPSGRRRRALDLRDQVRTRSGEPSGDRARRGCGGRRGIKGTSIGPRHLGQDVGTSPGGDLARRRWSVAPEPGVSGDR